MAALTCGLTNALVLNIKSGFLREVAIDVTLVSVGLGGVVLPPILGVVADGLRSQIFTEPREIEGFPYLALGTSLAFVATVLLFVALSYGGATITSIMATSEIVFSFLAQVWVMDQPASLIAILGTFLVMACMTLLVLEDAIYSPGKLKQVTNIQIDEGNLSR